MKSIRILVLGGTTEARKLVERLGGRKEIDVTISLAGRTSDPRPLPVKTRTGGFGGAQGLAAYLEENQIDLMIDATHPFANKISANAALAACNTGTAFFVLRRAAWKRQPGERWISTSDVASAAEYLARCEPRRVFLAIGRQEAHRFNAAPQHFYLIRSVDPVDPPLTASECRYILDTGPFDETGETALLKENAIDIVVAKNSGGDAIYGKIAAAHALGIEVLMVERRILQDTRLVETVEDALGEIDHVLSPAK